MAIPSYEALVDHCEMMGVQAPSAEACEKLFAQKQVEVIETLQEVAKQDTLSEPDPQEYSSLQEEVLQPQLTKEKKKKKTLKQDDTTE